MDERVILAAARAALAVGGPQAAGEVLRALDAPALPPAKADVEAPVETPVARRSRRRAKAKTPDPRRAPVPEPTTPAAQVLAQLLERHGDLPAIAELTGLGVMHLGRVRRNGSYSPDTLDRLRAALGEQGQGDDLEAPEDDEPEQARLARDLERKHGLEAIAERWSWSASTLERWKAGTRCSARVLSELRAALAADVQPRARREATNAGVSSPAGGDATEGHAA